MVSACRAPMTPAPMTAKRTPSLLSGAWWSAIFDTLRVQQPSERLGGTSEQFGAAKASGQMTGAEVRLHGEESVEAVGFESPESLGNFSVPLSGRGDMTGRHQGGLDMDVLHVWTQHPVCVGERLHRALHEVGRVPGQPELVGSNGLDHVQAACGDVAVDLLLVLVQQDNIVALGCLHQGCHAPQHLVAMMQRVTNGWDEEGKHTDVRRLQCLSHLQRTLESRQMGLEVFRNVVFADRGADRGRLYTMRRKGLAGAGDLVVVKIEDVDIP